MPDVDLHMGMPSRHIPQGRSYTNVVFEPTCGLLVAAALTQAKFSSYDEEGNETWVPDGMSHSIYILFLKYLGDFLVPNVSYPMSDSSALELFSSDFVAIDGYGFVLRTFCLLTYELVPDTSSLPTSP
jgi:cleavage and polyadenylation specificity factor subunit 1